MLLSCCMLESRYVRLLYSFKKAGCQLVRYLKQEQKSKIWKIFYARKWWRKLKTMSTYYICIWFSIPSFLFYSSLPVFFFLSVDEGHHDIFNIFFVFLFCTNSGNQNFWNRYKSNSFLSTLFEKLQYLHLFSFVVFFQFIIIAKECPFRSIL